LLLFVDANVLPQFAKVWGAAHATAIKWYTEGCQTLDDLRARTDLTQQQVNPAPYTPEIPLSF